MPTYKGIPFDGGLDSPSGTGAQQIVTTLKAIIDFLINCTTPGVFRDASGGPALDIVTKLLLRADGTHSVDFGNGLLKDGTGTNTTISWEIRQLLDANPAPAIDWGQRELIAEDGTTVLLKWSSGNLIALLPTSDPSVPGALWNNAGVVNVSP